MNFSTFFFAAAFTALLAGSSTTAFHLIPPRYSYIHLQPYHKFASAAAPSSPAQSSHGNGVPAPDIASFVPAASPPPPPPSRNTVPSVSPRDDETKCMRAMNDSGGIASCRYHHNQNYDAQKCCSYLATLVDSCSYVPFLQSQPFRDILRRVCDQASGSSPSS